MAEDPNDVPHFIRKLPLRLVQRRDMSRGYKQVSNELVEMRRAMAQLTARVRKLEGNSPPDEGGSP